MIVQLRVDERLIHGQITTAWSRFLNVDAIVVANDSLAVDKLTMQALLMSAPAGKKVAVKTIDGTVKLLSDPRADKMRVLVIVNNPKDAIELVNRLPIEDINVANYVKKKSPDKVGLSRAVKADAEDLAYFKTLCDTGKNVFSQLIPTLPKEDFVALVNEAVAKKQG
jgi:mannose/fructose/N-acetylgalactosamine-specific phosphotransferase system component IIB